MDPLPMKYGKFTLWHNNDAWCLSEKYNGIYVRYQNGKAYSKSGKVMNLPEYMTKNLPDNEIFDCELYSEIGLHIALDALHSKFDPSLHLIIFDIADLKHPFYKRYERLLNLHFLYRFPIATQKVVHTTELPDLLLEASGKNKEGFVLRSADGMYRPGKRVQHTLKCKVVRKGEARVIGVTSKHRGWSYVLKDVSTNANFKIYKHGRKIYDIGDFATYTYNMLNGNGIPVSPNLEV